MLNMDWMRQNKVNILKYLPEFLSTDENFKSAGNACSGEHELIRLQLQDIFQQFFIATATWGLPYWENMLAITPNVADSYAQRRKRILLRLQSNQISTVEYMTTLAKRYYSTAAMVRIEEDPTNYAFRLIADAVSYDPAGLIEAIETYKPAHLALIIVHYLYADLALYSGGFIQQMSCIDVYPAVDFSIEIDNSGLYAAGSIAISQTTNIS